MNFKKINNITGWVVCLIACSVYILTTEAGGSLWDCGEFVSSCFKLQVPHPPGAPMFVLLGRIFIVLFGGDPMMAAKAVNIMNALASGFTILFLFWTITHFARRIVHKDVNVPLTANQILSIMGAGAVGALAYTFSDSFWYSAVEGEVYAMSSFFTALVFWAILKWEHEADEPGADRWIVFIFFMMGLSIGVHLLNLLTIPAIVMVYYFRKQKDFNYKVIRKWFLILMVIGGVLGFIGALIMAGAQATDTVPMDSTLAAVAILGTAIGIGLLYLVESFNKAKKDFYGGVYVFFVLGCVLTGVVQVGVIQYSIKGAGAFDRLFVNSFGLPFFSGFAFFFVLLTVLIWLGLRFAAKKGWSYLRLGLWCVSFMLIGYSTYLTTMIRSSADPAVDMYNVDNPNSLVGYLSREQYGDFPILYGQKYTARPRDIREGATKYQKGKDKYIATGKDFSYVYAAEDKMLFPRVWDASNDQGHANYYSVILNINPQKDGSYDREPTQFDNLHFLFEYQLNFMYFRYFMWNFAGRANDIQGSYLGNPRDGQWITGISFLDAIRLGDQSHLPDSIAHNKARNTLFALPFILGVIGLIYHFRRKGSDAFVNFLLFFFTGIAIVIYLNQAGNQPRERDYAYVGSFYAFAVWIGLGVLKVREWLAKIAPGPSAALATVICLLAVPALMAQQEWDDHDRSKKQLARDLAKDYLESCAPNAILFSFGDNDTYPLWYAQEVEGIRTDVRVINYSLLGIDWYINQLRYKVNNSDSIDVIWTADQIEGRKRDYIRYAPKPEYPENAYYDLYTLMKDYIGSDDPRIVDAETSSPGFPVKNVSVPVDKNVVLANKTVNANDSVLSEIRFTIPRGTLMKNDLALLNIIAANKWKRPIYFTSNSPYQINLGFESYLRSDGMSYRLVPVQPPAGTPQNGFVNTDTAYSNVMNKFAYGNANLKGVYYDEENRRHLNSIRDAHTDIAIDLVNHGRKDDAKKILEKCDKMMLEENMPYGMTSRSNMHNRGSILFMEACFKAGANELANKVFNSVKKDLQQQLAYYNSLDGQNALNMDEDKNTTESFLNAIEQMKKMYTEPKAVAPEAVAKPDSTK